MSAYTEDTLVQQTAADYLRDALGWESVYAYNEETFGPERTLGRKSDRDVVLTRYLGEALVKLNPGLPMPAYQEAIRRITEYSVTQSTLQINNEKYELHKDGVLVDFRNEKGELAKRRLRVFDFDEPKNNHFLAVRELWVRGALYRRRADILGFVNGIPLLFMELKNIHKDIRAAYEKNLSDYKDTIPHLFHHNAVILLANGVDAKIGSLSGKYEHFHEWKRLEEDQPGVVDMATLLKGICNKSNFIDLFENFIVFDDSSGELVKIIARNHQYLGVNKAMQAVEERRLRKGKLGVFWHTQGAGKSYSMVFFSRKVHRRMGGNFTFLVLTDRDDLDTQIYKTFAGCGLVDNDKDPCRAESGKAMIVCIDKITCARMYELIEKYWAKKIRELEKGHIEAADEQELIYRRRQIKWMKETLMAVVISEEQVEVDKFRKWGLDITPHRKLIKEGFETNDGKRIDVDEAFKKEEHPFRIVIVCAMWMTGFDVPSLSTMYLDKPLKAHTLMQAIARANRVHEGKNNGLVVDYCGILKNLRKALATFAGHQGTGVINGEKPQPEVDPVKPEEELLADLAEAIDMIVAFLDLRNFRLDEITEKTSFDRNKAIINAKEAVNENDETRKRFEIIAREVFKKFKACITTKGINGYRQQCDAINIIYKSLQEDRDKADISDIIRELHAVVDKSIRTHNTDTTTEDFTPYDISKIDFDRLRKEFERTSSKNTTVQNLKHAIEKRLHRMIQQNPLRTDFQKHFEQIVEEYNREKDRVTIESTFEELLRFVDSLDEESMRAMQEGLDEESLAIFDLLVKPDLSGQDINQIKEVAHKLLLKLKSEKLRIDNWREKQATRDDVKVEIANFLWNERTGLPKSYSESEIGIKSEKVYLHVFQQYPNEQPAVYAEAF
jgi:type I site-specific restriction-modification system R (restriction) subunit